MMRSNRKGQRLSASMWMWMPSSRKIRELCGMGVSVYGPRPGSSGLWMGLQDCAGKSAASYPFTCREGQLRAAILHLITSHHFVTFRLTYEITGTIDRTERIKRT